MNLIEIQQELERLDNTNPLNFAVNASAIYAVVSLLQVALSQPLDPVGNRDDRERLYFFIRAVQREIGARSPALAQAIEDRWQTLFNEQAAAPPPAPPAPPAPPVSFANLSIEYQRELATIVQALTEACNTCEENSEYQSIQWRTQFFRAATAIVDQVSDSEIQTAVQKFLNDAPARPDRHECLEDQS